jgi:hypothetical protein
MWIRPFEDADGPFQANGTFSFNGTRAGGATAQDRLAMADFLLGLPSSFSQGGSQIVAEKMQYVGLYAQDVWRVNGNLTVNARLRWEPYLAAKDQNGFLTRIQPWTGSTRTAQRRLSRTRRRTDVRGDEGFPTTARTRKPLQPVRAAGGVVWDPSGEGTQTIGRRSAFTTIRRSSGSTGHICSTRRSATRSR